MADKKNRRTKEKRSSNSDSAKSADRHYRRMERHSKFWNRLDLVNRFRHWYLGAVSLTRSLFRVAAAWQTLAILVSILVILYIMTAFYTGKGEFVVKVDRTMADSGFFLSETTDFSEGLVTLRNDAVENVTNITLADIPKDVMNVDGKHNGRNYVAYTFYLKNGTGDTRDYNYELSVQSTSNDVDTASWVMVFKNGKQNIYALENSNGYPECLYSEWELPFTEYAEDIDSQQSSVKSVSKAHITEEMIQYHGFTALEGLYQLQTIPWESKEMVCTGTRKKLENEGVDKYTVVIWLEGDDPDCKDNLLGGHIEMSMKFMYEGGKNMVNKEAGKKDIKKQSNKVNKIRTVVMLLLLCIMLLSAATYAWFTLSNTARVANLTLKVGDISGLQIAPDEGNRPGKYGSVLDLKGKFRGKLLPATTRNGITILKPIYDDEGNVSNTKTTTAKDKLTASSSANAEGYYYEISFYLKSLGKSAEVKLKEGSNLSENGVANSKQSGTFVVNSKRSTRIGAEAIRISITDGKNTIVYEPNSNIGDNGGTRAEDKRSGTSCVATTSKQLANGIFREQTKSIPLSKDADTRITMRVWIEGTDTQCVNEIAMQEIMAQIQFTTGDAEE